LEHRQHLCDYEDAVAIPAIYQYTCERREQKSWDLSKESDYTEQENRTAQPIDQPARCNAGDPGPDQRDSLSAEEETIIAVL
jgi:hypothetical protein